MPRSLVWGEQRWGEKCAQQRFLITLWRQYFEELSLIFREVREEQVGETCGRKFWILVNGEKRRKWRVAWCKRCWYSSFALKKQSRIPHIDLRRRKRSFWQRTPFHSFVTKQRTLLHTYINTWDFSFDLLFIYYHGSRQLLRQLILVISWLSLNLLASIGHLAIKQSYRLFHQHHHHHHHPCRLLCNFSFLMRFFSFKLMFHLVLLAISRLFRL